MEKLYQGETRAEHRRYPRLRLRLRVLYRPLRKGEIAGGAESLAEDLGARGLAMCSNHPMRIGQLLKLTLYLPPEGKRASGNPAAYLEKDCFPVNILARVVWCHTHSEQEYILGIQFLDPDPEHRHRLKSFLIDYNLDRPDSALYL